MTRAGQLSQPGPMFVSLPNETRSASTARRAVGDYLEKAGLGDLAADAELVVTELVTNAVLYSDGAVELRLHRQRAGVRVSVSDENPAMPVVPAASTDSMTGRGLLLVRKVASRLGFETRPGGKAVWAELTVGQPGGGAGADRAITAWGDDLSPPRPAAPSDLHIELGDVPTGLLLDAKAHVDNLVREFTLAASDGATAAVPPDLAELIDAVVTRFSGPRLAIKRQALEASRKNLEHVRLVLDVSPDAADAAEKYLQALDEADVYCRAARLLTLETPPQHRLFRHWYVGEIIEQLRRFEAGLPPRRPQQFEDRLLAEVETVGSAWAAAERAARLYSLASALGGAMTPAAVAHAVLTEGTAALGASGGGLFQPSGPGRLTLPGTVGYDERLVASLREESPDADLPAAYVLRTGEPVWMESAEERDSRFPELVGLERSTVSMCAVPLRAGGRLLGAIRFSFSERRLFDDDERQFVLALAAQAAQALDRSRLHEDRTDLYHRLQRSLLPPGLPDIPGLDLAAVHHPLGEGIEIGGDFYDAWPLGEGVWAVALGDVCGTGPEAAGMSAFVRSALRAIAEPRSEHPALLRRLNDVLLRADDGDPERFCTVVFATVSRAGRDRWALRVTTGGHPEPLVRRANGEVETVPTDGSILGILPDIEVSSHEVVLAPGDRVLFYTDGASEARRDRVMLGAEGLAEALAGAPGGAGGTAAAIESVVLRYSGGRLTDDMAVLVLEVAAPDQEPSVAEGTRPSR